MPQAVRTLRELGELMYWAKAGFLANPHKHCCWSFSFAQQSPEGCPPPVIAARQGWSCFGSHAAPKFVSAALFGAGNDVRSMTKTMSVKTMIFMSTKLFVYVKLFWVLQCLIYLLRNIWISFLLFIGYGFILLCIMQNAWVLASLK